MNLLRFFNINQEDHKIAAAKKSIPDINDLVVEMITSGNNGLYYIGAGTSGRL